MPLILCLGMLAGWIITALVIEASHKRKIRESVQQNAQVTLRLLRRVK